MIQENIKQILRSYKSKQASKYIPVRGDEILTKVFDCEKYGISTKYDGHLCFIVKDKDKTQLLNFNGESFKRDELINEIDTLVKKEGIIVGEIYYNNVGERSRSFDLVKNLKVKDSSIQIVIFDILNYDDVLYENSLWEEKREIILKLFSKGKNIFPIEEIEVESRKEIKTEFEDRVNNKNQEGLIVRGFNGPIFKIKPKLTFDFAILGFSMGYSDDYDLLKELLFGVKIDNKEFLIIGKVSSGFTMDQRTSFLKDLNRIIVDSNIIEPSGSKTPFTFVKPELVIELESVDIINNTSDQKIRKSLIKFNGTSYSKVENKPSVSLISPVFKGLRDDKKVETDQVGINQILRIIDLSEEKEEISNKSNSKIIKKEVFVKERKGIKMVKKFFLWKTNSNSNEYPKFVFYKIDYSPSRGDKLQRDIKISDNKSQIEKIFSDQIKSDIKKGWDLFRN
jgi:ATP-dependent DNA ligase